MKVDDLYARDSKGRIKVWKGKVKHDTEFNHGVMITEDGLLEGKLVRRVNRIKEGKNIGKSNETTPFDQACNEMSSKHQHKKLTGYKSLDDLNIGTTPSNDDDLLFVLNNTLPKYNTDKDGDAQPMKAQQYYKTATDGTKTPRIKFPCLGQPKYNGVRCTAKLVNDKAQFKSKNGVVYAQLPHLEVEMTKVLMFCRNHMGRDFVLDGELYIHGYILSDIKSAVTKGNMYTPLVTFEMYDVAIADIPQVLRLSILSTIKHEALEGTKSINVTTTIDIRSDEQAQLVTDEWIKNRYEGGIFRAPKATYKFGSRPVTMTKLKRKEDAEFEIIDVVPMKKYPNLGMFICKNNINDSTFTVVAEGDHETKAKYLDDRLELIGQPLTVEFYERTKAPKEVPFHAVGITPRDYE